MVQFSGSTIDGGFLDRAYGTFHLHRCNVAPELWAHRWSPDEGGWISQAASRVLQERYRQKEERISQYGSPRRLNAVERARILQQLRSERVLTEDASRRSNAFAVLLSYLTLSRYGDIALRSFAFDEGAYRSYLGETIPETAWARRYDYSGWRRHAYGAIAIIVGLMVLATIGILRLQAAQTAWLDLRQVPRTVARLVLRVWYSLQNVVRRGRPVVHEP